MQPTRTNDIRQVIVSLDFLIKRERDPVTRNRLQQKLDDYRGMLHAMDMGLAANE